jgi:UDPglucose--hexose-1-phosphate uridylyltransferase
MIELPVYNENCPLCPGNERAKNAVTPHYQKTYVFINDFGALTESSDESDKIYNEQHPLFEANVANGECRVVCFSPDHNKSLPELSITEIEAVVNTWQSNYVELSKKYACVNIFENKGAIMGCSQPHPHGQIWAHEHLSTEIEQENNQQLAYLKAYGTSLLADYVEHERSKQERVVVENEHWLAVVPFWAAWPFETLLIAKDDVQHFGQLNSIQKNSLAQALQELTIRYDNVFNCSFPYSMGWHNAPKNKNNNDNDNDNSHWRLHAHFYPPLLRSASVKKHMVGYEMLAESQRDLTAETASKILRSASKIHYKKDQANDK